MMICLTSRGNGTKICLSHNLILAVRKDKETGLATFVMTGMIGPQGPVPFEVEESVEEIGLMVNRAIATENPHAVQFPMIEDLGFKSVGN